MSRKKAILIAEKPSQMLQIQEVYNANRTKIPYDVEFTTFAGHVMGLVEPSAYNPEWEKWDKAHLPMMPEQFIYRPTRDKVKMYKDVKTLVKNGGYDFVIVATDPGREGELIAWAFLEEVSVKIPVRRLWFKDMTEGKLLEALQNLRKYDALLNGLKEASFNRAQMDWLIGMNFSRAYGLTTGKNAPLGRVMTPTLKIVVDRELELRNFVPKPFWEIEADFGKYKGIYFDTEGNSQFLNKSKAETLIPQFGSKGKIIEVTKKKEMKYAPELHSLPNLQNECNRLFGYTMSETLAVAQSLYEKKLLSYPRTDSAFLTEALAKEFSKMLKPLTMLPGLESEAKDVMSDSTLLAKVGKNKKYVNDAKVTDHYAITPTGVVPDLGKLTKEEVNVYMTVARRFLAIFLPPMETQKTSIVTEANGHKFKTNGSLLQDLGFMRLYPMNSKDTLLPNVKKGEEFDLVNSRLIEKKTSPPPRYNDATLNAIMENVSRLIEDDEMKEVIKEANGIGTPATRGGIVDKLVEKKMIERKKKSFYATDYGISIIEGIGDMDIASPMLTAHWENKLSEMEKGNYSPSDFDKEMRAYISDMVNKLKSLKVSLSSDKPSLGECPKCGSKVVDGKDYYLCEKYKNPCDFIVGHIVWGAKVSKTELKKILSGKETKVMEFDNKKKQWKATLLYDKKKGALSFGNGSKGTQKSPSGSKATSLGTCPKCKGKVLEREKFYSCENNPGSCGTIIWKEMSGATITKEDVKLLLKGQPTEVKSFTWRSGKTGNASLRLGDKIEYIFN